jgi:DNA repair exonuclease SbcCD nuclease subunit
MSRFRFVHAADLHLDTPFDGLSRLGGDVPALLRDASLTAFDNLVAETLRVRADLLVLAGDIYDGPARGLRAQLRLREGLKRLSDAGVQVAMVHGNHDPVDEGWSAVGAWPDNVTVFPADAVGTLPLQRDGTPLARVHGISYPRRETTENLARRFPRDSGPGFAIGVLHCNVGRQAQHAAYSPCDVEDLRAADIDYWALGHIHARQHVAEGSPWAVYPGVLQGRSPKPSEQGPKGAVVVDVADGQVETVTFQPLDVVRFETLALDVADIPDLGALQDRLLGEAEAAVAAADGRQLILRAELAGRGSVHAALRRPGAAEDLLQALQESGHRVWWDRLADATAPPLDLDAIRRRGDFAAELLGRADDLQDDPKARAAFLDAHARPVDRKLRGLVDTAGEDEAALLSRAVQEALDRLEPGEDA